MSNTEQKVQTPAEAINPQVQGFINASISAAVREAVQGVFTSLAPMLKDMALTTEKIREANNLMLTPK
jgi:hypothetical protein